ncbi:MAG: hypothetical protein R3Y04_05180 [Rikenellaceae bacterium]
MKKQDFIFVLIIAVIVLPFLLLEPFSNAFMYMTVNHGYVMAFLKFGVLATIGEVIGLKVKEGRYNYKGFGILPRAIVWGIFGVWIAVAMKTFAIGAPAMVESFGLSGIVEAMKGDFTPQKLLGAFSISVMMNTIFAPVFMTLHKITDTHILENGGSVCALLRPIKIKEIITKLNWGVQWSFVFKKTIPFFWIPAHTITFLLAPTMQVLFAALLGVFLGLFLSIAAVLSRKEGK